MILKIEGRQVISNKWVIITMPVSQYVHPCGSNSLTTFQTDEQYDATKVVVEEAGSYSWAPNRVEVENVDEIYPQAENNFFHRCWWDDTVGGYHDYTIDLHLKDWSFSVFADDYDPKAVQQNNQVSQDDYYQEEYDDCLDDYVDYEQD